MLCERDVFMGRVRRRGCVRTCPPHVLYKKKALAASGGKLTNKRNASKVSQRSGKGAGSQLPGNSAPNGVLA